MSKKIRILVILCLGVFLPLGLHIRQQVRFYSTDRRVAFYEKAWDIELPDEMKLKYRGNEIAGDGSMDYCVFSCKKEPAGLFSDAELEVKRDIFEKWFSNSIKSFIPRYLSDARVPEEFRPDFTIKYEYIFLQSLSTSGNRYYYLFGVYYPDSMRLILCDEVRQYAHREEQNETTENLLL